MGFFGGTIESLAAFATRNFTTFLAGILIDSPVSPGLVEIAFDPQTSGGLLIAVPKEDAPRLVEELQANGVNGATIVGYGALFQKTPVALV